MTKKANSTNKWLVQSLRATFFTTGGINIDKFLESKAEFEVVMKEESPKIARQNIIAISGETKLNIQILPFRVDLNVSPKDEISATPPNLVTLGDQKEVLDDFLSFAQDFVDMAVNKITNKITRVALGCVLLMPVKNHDEGYSTVSSYLPFEMEGKDSSDFNFQINKPTTSKVVNTLTLNRLSIWSVMRLNLSIQPTVELKGSDLVSEMFYSKLELDMSTDQQNTRHFSVSKIKNLLEELNELSIEVSQNGIK